MKRVLFAERRLPHYRVGLIEGTRTWLEARGVTFHFIYGTASPSELSKRDEGEITWAQRMTVTRYFLDDKVVWQPFDTSGYDLVIVSQENGLLFNHWLCRPWRPFRLGFFGHGANFNARHDNTLRERFRRFTTRRVDWWFAYTSISRRLALDAGFAPDRVTVVNNATDTELLRYQLAAVSQAQVRALRQAYGLTPGNTALFLGSIYPGKGLELLLEAAAEVSRSVATFRLLVVGDGPSRPWAEQRAKGSNCVAFLGAKRGAEKAALMAVSDFMVMPGAVGLSIVDAFAAGLPLLTTSAPGHGPEIAYLEAGCNGDMTPPDATSYATAMLRLLCDPALLRRWHERARADGQLYSLQSMAERFGQGILDALARPRR